MSDYTDTSMAVHHVLLWLGRHPDDAEKTTAARRSVLVTALQIAHAEALSPEDMAAIRARLEAMLGVTL